MRRKLVFSGLLFSILFLFSCHREEPQPTLLERLDQIPGVHATAIDTLPGFQQTFLVYIRQSLDHQDKWKWAFQQMFYLSFRSEDAPTVFYTSGYGVKNNYESEPAALLQANQVLMVHRYFPNAYPSLLKVPPNEFWSYLTIAQAAADQHEIRERLREILPGKWVSSGASKGGMTALFYRYYYPADVEATIAYVAPLMERPEDRTLNDYFYRIGTDACREKLLVLQREFLRRRAALLPLVHAHALQMNYSFTVFSEEQAFEYAVIDYPEAFWQYKPAADCASIPGPEAPDQVLFDHLADVSSFYEYSDAGYYYYQPLFYQAFTEIGYCAYMYEHLAGLLQAVPAPTYRVFAPRGVEMTFRPEVMGAVLPWLRHQGERIIYIYGENDPWTAAALYPDQRLDVVHVVQPGANHSVQIRDLDQKGLVIAALERWLGIDIDETKLAGVARVEEKERL